MNIIIRNLDKEKHRELSETLGDYYYKSQAKGMMMDSVDVRLNDYVIVKAYDDCIMLDFGGKLAAISVDSFEYLKIY